MGPRRCIATDLYFASVQAAKQMLEEGFDFLGPVKSCHREYPKQFVEGLEIPPGRGHTWSIVSDDDDRTRATHNIACDAGSWRIPRLMQHQSD